ncbi:MAG TPA: hypothetical protein VNZ02_15430 [Steroidobacteraceae bacterium]|jgi:hypothetical protein|nr:hypothetical protein [Steroidobacteraceae bacterium]
MRVRWIAVVLLLELLAGCASESASKPVEYLDPRTAMTVASLKQPIELVPSGSSAGIVIFGKRTSFAYLGPVEWDRSGTYAYGLWIHIAPGNDRPMADIRAPASLTLILDGGPQVLQPIDAPPLGQGAYQPVASWGQTSYFKLTEEMLRLMAGSLKLQLDARAADGSIVSFVPGNDTRPALSEYLRARGITAD